jgi:hypothetical protein
MSVRTIGWLSISLLAFALNTGPVIAGPAEDANAALDRFSAAYTANDVDALVQLYSPNAILLGTNSPIISEGRDAVRAYFTNLKLTGSGCTSTAGVRLISFGQSG